jgi:drug/metabolite transporter (DMT)-like permease
VTRGHYAGLVQSPGKYGDDGLIILGALCWVIYTIGAAFFPAWSPYRYTTITTGLGLATAAAITVVLLAFGVIDLPSGHAVVTITPELAYMASAAGFVGVLCWNLGNKILTPLNGVLFMDVVPVTAFTISAIQGVHLALPQVLGGCVTATALILNNVYLRHRMTPAAKPSAAPAPVPAPADARSSAAILPKTTSAVPQ